VEENKRAERSSLRLEPRRRRKKKASFGLCPRPSLEQTSRINSIWVEEWKGIFFLARISNLPTT
jgi:ribosomal protein L44E